MTFLTYIDDCVDIHVIPSVEYPLWGRPGDEIVLGDLHANTMKLIYALTRHNVIYGMTVDKYHSLVQICTKTAADLTKADLREFSEILNSFPYNKVVTVNLLGNDLAGTTDNCDVLTMLVIKILKQNQVQTKISLSSRTYQMIEACELKTGFDFRQDCLSMRGVHEIIQNGLMTTEDVFALYNDFYKNALRVNSRIFDMSPEGKPIVYLLNHAGVDLANIRRQTEYLMNNPLPNHPTLKEFNQTLDAIDRTFRAILAGNLVNQLRDPNREVCDALRYPFEAPITDEQKESQSLCEEQMDFQLRYIYSTGQIDLENPHLCALTSELGKTKNDPIGKYVVGYKTSHTLPPEFVEKYDVYSGSEVRKLRLTGRSTHKPLSRTRRGLFVFNDANTSPKLLSFQGVYESSNEMTEAEMTNEIERGYSVPQVELRLDSNSSLSHSQNTARDSLQSTTVSKSEQSKLFNKTLAWSPLLSFYEDDCVPENRGP